MVKRGTKVGHAKEIMLVKNWSEVTRKLDTRNVCRVVLVTLINIFTSPKTYIWGKVAVLGIAFFTLIAWMVVTVFFKPAIFR